mgnify:CR=1 FL=1
MQMLKRISFAIGWLTLLSVVTVYILTLPRSIDALQIPPHKPDLTNGETLFWAGGCASCHAAKDAQKEARLTLAGGLEIKTAFGIFRSPNLSPDPETGIGLWNNVDFINAMVKGISPDGSHYYPAFPYTHYQIMPFSDLIDLKAFLDTLPAQFSRVAEHDLNFPFNIREGLGLWKLLYLQEPIIVPVNQDKGLLERGRYLVNGPGHCGSCHTPRTLFGGEISDRFLAGAPSLEPGDPTTGKPKARIPNITPHADGIEAWSIKDITYALETGLDPDFDSFGDSMVEVQENMAKLSAQDRLAIATYLKSIPALPSEK